MNSREMLELINSARRLEIEKNKQVEKLMDDIENRVDRFLDDIPSFGAENADNLKEAIMCYINYGEYNAVDLVSDIVEAISKYSIYK